MAKVLLPLAQGFEELEAITIIDLLRRADIEVVSAYLDHNPVLASRHTSHMADMSLDSALSEEYDMLVLPGGLPGADNLNNDSRITKLIQKMQEKEKHLAAICAAPKVFADKGLLKDRQATSYPGVLEAVDVENTGNAVEVDGKIITSRGPGTAMDFALNLIEVLAGSDTRNQVESSLVR